MSKKDYELIAATLRYCSQHCDTEEETRVVAWVADHFADALAGTNPRFDSGRFMAACRGEDSTDSAGRKVRYS